MVHNRVSWRMRTRRAALALAAAALPFAGLGIPAVDAQSYMRGPNINVSRVPAVNPVATPRITPTVTPNVTARITPTLTPTVTPRINPNIASGAIAAGRTTP